MSKSTPGPWFIQTKGVTSMWRDGIEGIAIAAPYLSFAFGRDVALVPENKADALLIAAAPDLLEACKESLNALLDYIETLESHGADLNYGHKVIEQLTTAIAKAEGK